MDKLWAVLSALPHFLFGHWGLFFLKLLLSVFFSLPSVIIFSLFSQFCFQSSVYCTCLCSLLWRLVRVVISERELQAHESQRSPCVLPHPDGQQQETSTRTVRVGLHAGLSAFQQLFMVMWGFWLCGVGEGGRDRVCVWERKSLCVKERVCACEKEFVCKIESVCVKEFGHVRKSLHVK